MNDSKIKFEMERLFNLSLDMLAIASMPKGKWKRINPAFSRILGWSEEELMAIPCLDLVHPEDFEKSKKAKADLMLGNPLVYFEHRVRCKNGVYKWIAWNMAAYTSEEEIYCVGRDITEKKKAKETLQQSKNTIRDEALAEAELEISKQLQLISTELIQADNIEALYNRILDTVTAVMKSDFASIQMLVPEHGSTGKLLLLGYHGLNAQAAEFWKVVDATSQTTCGISLRTGQRVVVSDVQTCELMVGSKDKEMYLQSGIRATQTTPLLSRSGKIIGMLSTHWRKPHEPSKRDFRVLDILARLSADLISRKQKEDVLQEREARIKSILQGAPIGIGLLHDRTFTEVNDQVSKITGYSRDELIGQSTKLVYLSDEDFKIVGKEKEHQIAKFGSGLVETRIKRKDDRILDVLVSSTPLNDNASAGTTFTVMDITERKQAEKEARKNQAKFQAAMASIADAMFITDAKGRFIEFNDAFATFHRFRNKEECCKTLDEYPDILEAFLPDGTLAPIDKRVIPRALRGETAIGAEYTMRRKDTGETWIGSYSFAPIRDGEGAIVGSVAVGRDITEQKRMAQALQKMNDSLEQQVAERTKLAESRTKQLQSLAVKLIEAEERERKRIAELLHEDLQQILASARMQVQLSSQEIGSDPILKKIDKLIAFAIEKSRNLSHRLSPPVLHQFGLISGLDWLVRQMDEQFGLKINLKTEEIQRTDSSIEVFLFRTAQELLYNIIKHSGVKSAQVILSGTDEQITLSVKDQGQGFKKEILNHGTGLGIASVREHAIAIGGTLDINSAPGQGSRFTLKVPVRLNSNKKSNERSERQSGTQNDRLKTDAVSKIRVLLADDHKVMRQGLVSLLTGQPDIEVVGEAGDGEEVLKLARQLRPDIVLMDISMPKRNGVEATRLIKADMPDIMVIGLSMFYDEKIAQKMLQAGAGTFITKMNSSAELLKAIYEIAALNKGDSIN